MARTYHVLVANISLVAHGLADPAALFTPAAPSPPSQSPRSPEESKFMGKSFVPAMPVERPASPAQLIGKTPVSSFGAAGYAPLANPVVLVNIQREIAQSEAKNLAMKSDLQQFSSQMAIVAGVQSQMHRTLADPSGTSLAVVFGIAVVVGAFLYFVIDKLAKNHPSNMGVGAELQLSGAQGATVQIPTRSDVLMRAAARRSRSTALGMYCGTPPSRDPYTVVGVERSASMDEIRAAYRRRVRAYHPDTSGDAASAPAFRELVAAFKTLHETPAGSLETHPLWTKLSGLDRYWSYELGCTTAEELEEWLIMTSKMDDYVDEEGKEFDDLDPSSLDALELKSRSTAALDARADAINL